MTKANRERNHVIKEMVNKGASLYFIGKCYGISRERVRQIAKREEYEEEKRKPGMCNSEEWIYSLPDGLRRCLQRGDIDTKEQLYEKIEKGHFGIRCFGDKRASELNDYLDRKITLGKPIKITKKYKWCEDITNTVKEIQFLDEAKENRKDWKDVPANKMTVVQLREAVKELRKELATIKGL